MTVESLQSNNNPPLFSEMTYYASGFAMNLTGEVQGGFSIPGSLQERLNSKALNILGMSSCLNLFTGPMGIHHGVRQINLSQKLKDYWGEVQGYLKALQGGAQTVAGAAYLPASMLIGALIFTSSKVMTVAAEVLTGIGGVFLAIGSAFQMLESSINLYHGAQLRKRVQSLIQNNGPESALKTLQDEMTNEGPKFERSLGEKATQKILEAGPEQAQEILEQALKALTKQISQRAIEAVLSFAAIALTVATFIITGGTAPLILGVIGTVLGLMFLALDVQNMSEQMNAPIGQLDKVWVFMSTGFSALLIAAAIITATHPLVIVIIALTAAMLLFVHLACLQRIYS